MNSQFHFSVAVGVFRSRRFQSAHPEVGAPQSGLCAFRRTTIGLGAAKTLGAKLRTRVAQAEAHKGPFYTHQATPSKVLVERDASHRKNGRDSPAAFSQIVRNSTIQC